MKSLSVEIKALAGVPMLMHSVNGLDPTHPLVRRSKEITSKKKKTDADLTELDKLKWEIGLYHDATLGVYVPAIWIESNLRDGAKQEKKGKLFSGAVLVEPFKAPLSYKGPRDIEGMWKAGSFVDRRPVVINRARVMASRPCFIDWSLKFIVIFDERSLDQRDIEAALDAGSRIGLGDFRPRFGRYEVVSCKAA